MKQPHRLLFTFAAIGAFGQLSGCSSRFRNNNEAESSAENTSTSETGGHSGGAAGDTSTGHGRTGGLGGTGGGATVGGSGEGPGGSGGTASSPAVMRCEPTDANCTCDATGCFLVPGAECTRPTDCKTQICGVTQAADNVCCTEECDTGQVCSDDGSGCEAAEACQEGLERCSADGNHERCSGSQWDSVTTCDALGCSIELMGGCLAPLGSACVESEECGQGSCQETPEGSFVCCEASCGDCQVCNHEGNGCAEPQEVKLGCDCTEGDASNCDDDVGCTVDTCQDGRCSNELQSGYCLIDGQCYDHNQPEAGNPCRYCDATLRDRAWTNSANTVGCDDSAWCNGEDTCNGTGQCLHEFPTSDRCTESGPCALTACDEERDSCYQPDTFVCSAVEDDRCKPVTASSPKCSDAIQVRTTTTYCSGVSAACDGATATGNFVTTEDCGGTCNAETVTCVPTLACATWCDDSTGLCWTGATQERTVPFAEADEYCGALDIEGSTDWRLPTINDWLQLAKGCDDVTGEAQPVTFQSTCDFEPQDESRTPCVSSCPEGNGPANGCYWPTTMGGSCSSLGYWSATRNLTYPGRYAFSATRNWVDFLDVAAERTVRCVTVAP